MFLQPHTESDRAVKASTKSVCCLRNTTYQNNWLSLCCAEAFQNKPILPEHRVHLSFAKQLLKKLLCELRATLVISPCLPTTFWSTLLTITVQNETLSDGRIIIRIIIRPRSGKKRIIPRIIPRIIFTTDHLRCTMPLCCAPVL